MCRYAPTPHAGLYLESWYSHSSNSEHLRQMSDKRFLSEVSAVILEQGLEKARAQILRKQLENHGGKVEKTLSQGTTHILVGRTTRLSRIPNLLKIKSISEGVLVLRADWLSACLVEAEMVGHGAYMIHPEPSPTASPNKDSQSQVSPGKVSSTISAVVTTPLKPKETVSPSQATKPSPSTATEEGLAGESKSADTSPSKTPTTPTRPAASLTSPKVLCYFFMIRCMFNIGLDNSTHIICMNFKTLAVFSLKHGREVSNDRIIQK